MNRDLEEFNSLFGFITIWNITLLHMFLYVTLHDLVKLRYVLLL